MLFEEQGMNPDDIFRTDHRNRPPLPQNLLNRCYVHLFQDVGVSYLGLCNLSTIFPGKLG